MGLVVGALELANDMQTFYKYHSLDLENIQQNSKYIFWSIIIILYSIDREKVKSLT